MNNEVKSIEDLATVIKNDIASVETKNAAVVEKLQKSVDELNAEVKKSKIGAAAGVETKSPLLETLEKSNLKSRTRGQGFDLEISTKAAVDMLAPTAVLSTAIPTLLPYQNVPTSVEDVIAKGTIQATR